MGWHTAIGWSMSPRTRRVVQAILYEVIAIAVVGPLLGFIFDEPVESSLVLAFILSTIALGWNYVFNGLFERWEGAQASGHRTFARRLAHGVGFEGGLVFLLTPVMAWWLDTTLLRSLVTNLGLLVFFFVYAIVFTWCFDRVFGLPESARRANES